MPFPHAVGFGPKIVTVLLGGAALAWAQGPMLLPERQVELPFLPGTPFTIHWRQDLGIDRSTLVSCQSETSRWESLCARIHDSDAQQLELPIPQDEEVDSPSAVGYFRPHPVLLLDTFQERIRLELVPVHAVPLMRTAAEGQDNVTIAREGNRIVCGFSQGPQKPATVHSIRWHLERKKSPPLDYEADFLTLEQVRATDVVSCKVVWFDGLFFRLMTTSAPSETLLAEVPETRTPEPSPLASASPSPSPTPARPRDRLLAPLFVPLSRSGETEFHVSLLGNDSEKPPAWRCRMLPEGAGTCQLETSPASALVKAQVKTGQHAAVVISVGAEVSSTTALVPDAESAWSGMTRPGRIATNDAGFMECKPPDGVEPLATVWFRNGLPRSDVFGEAVASRDAAPLEPVHHACVTLGLEGAQVVAGLATTTQTPSEPLWSGLPEIMLADTAKDLTWRFSWKSSVPEPLRLACRIRTQDGTGLETIPCFQERSPAQTGEGRLEIGAGLSRKLAALQDGSGTWKDFDLEISISSSKNSFKKTLPLRIPTVVRRPRILTAAQYPESPSRAGCIFVAADPDGSHLTATLRWLDDPGQAELFSTFSREGFSPLPPASELEGLGSLPSHVRAGRAQLDFRTGRASCEITVSDGILFTKMRAPFYRSRHAAMNEIAAALRPRSLERQPRPIPQPVEPVAVATAQPTPSLSFIALNGETPSSDNPLTWWHPERGSCVGTPSLCDEVLPLARRNPSSLVDAWPGLAILADKKEGRLHFALVEVVHPAFSLDPAKRQTISCASAASALRLRLWPEWASLEIEEKGGPHVLTPAELLQVPPGTDEECTMGPRASLPPEDASSH